MIVKFTDALHLIKILTLFCFLFLLIGCGTHWEEVDGDLKKIVPSVEPIDPIPPKEKIELSQRQDNDIWSRYVIGGDNGVEHFSVQIESMEPISICGAGGKKVVTLSHIVVDDILYLADGGKIKAIGMKTGSRIWSYSLNKRKNASGSLAYHDGKIFATCGNNTLTALSSVDGSKLWTADLSGVARSTPLIVDNVVIVQCIDNATYGFDVKTGEMKWRHSRSPDNILFTNVMAPMKTVDSKVLVQYSNSNLFALDPQNGVSSWDVKSDTINWSGFNIGQYMREIPMQVVTSSDGYVAMCDVDGSLVMINGQRGNVLWRKNLNLFTAPCMSGNVIYAISDNVSLVAISKKTGDILWKSDLSEGDYYEVDPKLRGEEDIWYSPMVVDDYVMVINNIGDIIFVDPYDGAHVRIIEMDYSVNSIPMILDKHLYFYSRNGKAIMML